MAENKLKYNNTRTPESAWDETTSRMSGFTGSFEEDMETPFTGRSRWGRSSNPFNESGFQDTSFNPNFGTSYGVNSPYSTFGTPYSTPYGTPVSNTGFNTMNTPYGTPVSNPGFNTTNTPYGYGRTNYGRPVESTQFNGVHTNGRSFETTSPYNTTTNTPWQTPGTNWPANTNHGFVPYGSTWVPGLTNVGTHTPVMNGTPFTNVVPGTTVPVTSVPFTPFGTTVHGTPVMNSNTGWSTLNTPFTTLTPTHRGHGPKGYRRSDERITEDICDRLCDNFFVDATDVEVIVESGEVTLIGTVESREAKRLVEDICETISGVCNVENRLRICDERTTTKTSSTTSTTTESKTKRSTLTTAPSVS